MTAVVTVIASMASCDCGKPSSTPTRATPARATPATQSAANPSVAQPSGYDGIKLVVLIVIDQLPSWTFTRDASQLKGGLGRLLRESVYFPDADIPYANTYTAPGHAAIATGASPRVTGILSNGWIRSGSEVVSPATADPRYPLYDSSQGSQGKPSTTAASGASSMTLKVEGIADVLAREKPLAKSVAVGLKQRATILMLGKRPTRAVWYESSQAAMTTSTFYGELPEWLIEYNKHNPLSAHFADEWNISDPDYLLRYLGSADDGIGEGSGDGLDTTFPHSISKTSNPSKAVRIMPSSVSYLLGAAEAAIDGEKLGHRGERDLLAITISTHDYVGHFWGQESWERFDALRRIDAALTPFFAKLDRDFGTNGYIVVLTSDHGAVPMIEQSRKQGRPARRIEFSELADATNRGLERVLGKGSWVTGYAANSAYLSKAFLAKPKPLRQRALKAAATELGTIHNIALATLTDSLAATADRPCSARTDPDERAACESIDLTEAGQLTILPDRYSLFQIADYTTGTGHGTQSPECRQVPIIVRTPKTTAHTATTRVSMLAVAPTLSVFLGISAPEAAKEPPLSLTPDQDNRRLPPQ